MNIRTYVFKYKQHTDTILGRVVQAALRSLHWMYRNKLYTRMSVDQPWMHQDVIRLGYEHVLVGHPLEDSYPEGVATSLERT
eukprot:848330-Pyramimonas_sp.AAC.1